MSLENNSENIEIYDTFEDLDLKDNLLRGIYGFGFEKPSAIQQKAIMPFLKGHDIIAQAQSGTGKTATFAISLLQSIDEKLSETQAVVVSQADVEINESKAHTGNEFLTDEVMKFMPFSSQN